MRAWPIVALLAVSLAGCAGDDGDDPPAGADAGTSTTAAPSGDSVEDLQELRTSIDVAWNGRTKEGAWLCSDQAGTGQCPAGQQVAPDGEHVTNIPYSANLTLVDVNLTWQADPTQTGLVFAAYGNTSSGLALLGHVRGTSPLNLRLAAGDLASAMPGDAVVFMVWPEGKTSTQPSVYVDATRQSFAVEGRLETVDQVRGPAAN